MSIDFHFGDSLLLNYNFGDRFDPLTFEANGFVFNLFDGLDGFLRPEGRSDDG